MTEIKEIPKSLKMKKFRNLIFFFCFYQSWVSKRNIHSIMNTMIFLVRDTINKSKRIEGIKRYTMEGIKWELKNQPFKHTINPSLPSSFILMPKLGKNFMHGDKDFFAKEFC
jgi:hypothetical protein